MMENRSPHLIEAAQITGISGETMLKKFVQLIGGDPAKKQIEELALIADTITALEPQFEALSDAELSAMTREFRIRLAKGETLEDILPEAFALVREASKRTIGLRHYDIQLIGGIALHRGIIAEMKTGEGKTLVATLPLYLNALTLNPEWVELAQDRWGSDPEGWTFEPIDRTDAGRGVHLITVNDYLARRDARWKAPIYNMLGLSVGVLQMAARTEHGKKAFLVDLEKSSPHEDQDQLQMVDRKLAYNADITYGTNNEFGFDYLRDNMKMSLAERVQRDHHYAIIDEVDNVLIDEARTPLIISGPSHEDSENYIRMAQVVKQLKPEDYEISERDRTITLTEIGETHVEQVLGMALRDPERPEDVTPEQARLLGYLEQALRAEYIYNKNKEYIVQGGRVVIVDEFTGRLMPGRRWSDGLHQAVEAKEGAKVQSENVTYATITIQNYFRMYEKLSGMTGTAVTEAEEFLEIYNLDALAIPTNLEYQATGENAAFQSLEGHDQYNYKFTYYVPSDQPDSDPLFWKRKDYQDVIYRTEEAKLRAIVREIITYHVIGRPILVGTTSVEYSDRLSRRLRAEPVRRLAQTLLIRELWLKVNDRIEDGRQISELVSLNAPLEKLRPSDLRQLIREMELGISLNPEDDRNIDLLIEMLDLTASHRERLEGVMKGGVPCQVLNARKHTEESQIIAGAGAFGAVTIATNMAGRGVDIKLGGELAEEVISTVNRVIRRAGYKNTYDMTLDEKRQAVLALAPDDYGIYGAEIEFFLSSMDDMEMVKALGGLHVIGSERHEARRIDNQLRGRSARQGDPGSSRFYLSLEDELMIRFGGQQMDGLLTRLNVDEALPIENNLVTRIVESSQTRVEGANFDVRKHLLEYDDVLNTQRTKIYGQRDRIFLKDDLDEDVTEMLREEVLRRVPEALQDEGGPWKLLSWLEQIQPPIPLSDGIFPSFILKLLLEDINGGQPTGDISQRSRVSIEKARQALLDLAVASLQAEKEHHLQNVTLLLEQSQVRMQLQLEERLETLDTIFEGLEVEAETRSSNPQALALDVNNLLRLPIKLTNHQVHTLGTDPEAVGDVIRDQIEKLLMGLTIVRLIGAVERVLKEPLGFTSVDLQDHSWDDLSKQVLDGIENIFTKRIDRYIGDGTPGQLVADLDAGFSKLDAIIPKDILGLMVAMPQGRQAAFDKKTHRRVWVRTNRLTYIFNAAHLLENRDPEEIAEDVLAHLEDAQTAIRYEWGQHEFNRLADTRLSDTEGDVRAGLQRVLSDETFASIEMGTFNTLNEEYRTIVINELGRQGLTKVYRQLLLSVISNLWVEYLTQVEALRVSIGLEAYAQRDPLVQYKTKAFEMFQNLLRDMRISVVTRMFTFQARDRSALQVSVSREDSPPPELVGEPAQKAPQEKKKKKRRRRRR
jgi:preprotein translocase subunit SecA